MSHTNVFDGRGRPFDPYRFRAQFPGQWSAFLRANFRSAEEVAVTFDVTFQTASNWLHGTNRPTGDKVAIAALHMPRRFAAAFTDPEAAMCDFHNQIPTGRGNGRTLSIRSDRRATVCAPDWLLDGDNYPGNYPGAGVRAASGAFSPISGGELRRFTVPRARGRLLPARMQLEAHLPSAAVDLSRFCIGEAPIKRTPKGIRKAGAQRSALDIFTSTSGRSITRSRQLTEV